MLYSRVDTRERGGYPYAVVAKDVGYRDIFFVITFGRIQDTRQCPTSQRHFIWESLFHGYV